MSRALPHAGLAALLWLCAWSALAQSPAVKSTARPTADAPRNVFTPPLRFIGDPETASMLQPAHRSITTAALSFVGEQPTRAAETMHIGTGKLEFIGASESGPAAGR
jgi:hypothetical protein